MTAAEFVHCLQGARETRRSHWVARCPAHNDRAPSLAVRETQDGKILLHCFAGCTVQDVCDALGVRVSALFSGGNSYDYAPERRPFDPVQILIALAHEATVLVLISETLRAGKILTTEMILRLDLAAGRINGALQYVSAPESAAMKRVRRGETRVGA